MSLHTGITPGHALGAKCKTNALPLYYHSGPHGFLDDSPYLPEEKETVFQL